jgi:hypothetical protein
MIDLFPSFLYIVYMDTTQSANVRVIICQYLISTIYEFLLYKSIFESSEINKILYLSSEKSIIPHNFISSITDPVSPYFLANLKIFNVKCCTNLNSPFIRAVSRLPNLMYLNINSSNINMDSITFLIRRCKTLKILLVPHNLGGRNVIQLQNNYPKLYIQNGGIVIYNIKKLEEYRNKFISFFTDISDNPIYIIQRWIQYKLTITPERKQRRVQLPRTISESSDSFISLSDDDSPTLSDSESLPILSITLNKDATLSHSP